MKISIDVSPLESGHKVRGVGFYLSYLKDSLSKYFPENDYFFFTDQKSIPTDSELVHYPYFDPFFITLPFHHSWKTVVTVHDLTPIVFPHAFPAGMKGKLKWQLQKLSLRRASAIITDSEASKKDLITYTGIPPKQITVVYLAAGEAFTDDKVSVTRRNELLKKYDLPESFVLYVGDVTWNKNLPRLLDAIATTDIPLVMVGKALTEEGFDRINPWNADRVEVLKKSAKNPNIHRLGFIPTDDVVALYKMAQVFVLPSLYEGFGLPVLEAMSCGTPVVTTEKGSLREVAGDAAFYVDPESTESIAAGIKKVFHDKNLRNDLSAKGLLQAKKFSWQKTAKETMNVYLHVAKSE